MADLREELRGLAALLKSNGLPLNSDLILKVIDVLEEKGKEIERLRGLVLTAIGHGYCDAEQGVSRLACVDRFKKLHKLEADNG